MRLIIVLKKLGPYRDYMQPLIGLEHYIAWDDVTLN